MGASSTLSSTIVYCVLPDCKGQHTNLAGQHQKKKQQNNPTPTGKIEPKAETYIPGWVNSFHKVLVSSDGCMLKGVNCKELLRRCWHTLCTGMDGRVARCWSSVSLWLHPMCCQMQKCRTVMLIAHRFAISNETLTFKMGVSYLGGR